MMNAVVIDEQGEPDVMQYRPIEMPPLKSRQVRIAMRACSLNYHDVSCAHWLFCLRCLRA